MASRSSWSRFPPINLSAKFLQSGDFGGQVVGVDIQVHPSGAVAEPLDEQPEFGAVERGAVVFGLGVEPGQRLAGSCAPERQLAVVIGSRDINHDLGQPAVVSHPVNLCGLTGRAETGTASQRTRSGMTGCSTAGTMSRSVQASCREQGKRSKRRCRYSA